MIEAEGAYSSRHGWVTDMGLTSDSLSNLSTEQLKGVAEFYFRHLHNQT